VTSLIDAARYYAALALLLTVPGAGLHWFLIHPFVRFWRRVGPGRALAAVLVLKVALAVVAFLARGVLLAPELGARPLPALAGLAVGALGITLDRKRGRELSTSTMLGLAELTATPGAAGGLATEGIYARLRHPRYVAVVLNLTAWALLTGYVAVYGLLLGTIVAILGIVPLEERELEKRFGQRFELYRQSVPAFVPRLQR